MPSLKEMFPSKYLQAEDLQRGRFTLVTIEKVYAGAARQTSAGAEPEIKWYLRLREFRKPMGLWGATARVIAEVLGADRTEQWEGRRINIYPSTYTSFGETKPCIAVDPHPVEAGLPAEASVGAGGGGLVNLHEKRPIPREAVERFLTHCRAVGKGWEDFLRWSKINAPDALALAFGVDFDAVPSGIVPAMKAYLDSLQLPAPGAAAGAGDAAGPGRSVVGQIKEIIDKRTGEVTPAPHTPSSVTFTPAAAAAAAASGSSVGDDDIPF